MTNPTVVIVTWCKDIEALYGTLLTFKTLRIGFPTYDVIVLDNGSIPEALTQISAAANSVGADCVIISPEVSHASLIERAIMNATIDKIVFVDPDVVFWKNMENIEYTDRQLLAGRYIPQFMCPFSKALTRGRIHTSMMVFPHVLALQNMLKQFRQNLPGIEFEPFSPRTWFEYGQWHRHDTTSALFHFLENIDSVHRFDDIENNKFDHIFCGSHMKYVASTMPENVQKIITLAHDAARSGELETIKGIWRNQEKMFEAQQ